MLRRRRWDLYRLWSSTRVELAPTASGKRRKDVLRPEPNLPVSLGLATTDAREMESVMKAWVELYLDDEETPQTALYDLPGVPRRGEQFAVFKFDRIGTVQTVRWTPDEERQDIVLVVHAK